MHAFPELLPILQEHLADNQGEVLPHLFISDVGRWLAASVGHNPQLAGNVLAWLEVERAKDDPDVGNLIDDSFVEMLPFPGESGEELRSLLGPVMAAEAEKQLRRAKML